MENVNINSVESIMEFCLDGVDNWELLATISLDNILDIFSGVNERILAPRIWPPQFEIEK